MSKTPQVTAHSKWMDIYPVKSATSQVTIARLRQSFCVFSLLKMLVSDNGTCFTSAEFETFMKQNGIDRVRSAPFHPSSNDLAERAVQTFKEGMKKVKEETLQITLSRFLFSYRNHTACNNRLVTYRTDDVTETLISF